MNEWILFTIGILIGSISGVMFTAVLSARRCSNMESEIQDLRTQRVLLKEELLKKQPSKPKPRKYRKKNVRSK
jgi:hypothetical protein